LAAIIAVSAAVIVHRAAGNLSAGGGLAQASVEAEPARDAAQPAAAEPAAELPAIVADREAGRAGESAPLDEPLPAPVVAALDVAKPSAVAASARPLAPARAAPSPAELQAALSATPIVLYSASWCPVCDKAKRFLADNGLRFQEIDADVAPGGWDKVQALTGRRAVPVIVVDGEVNQGLGPQQVMRSVARSMERRLGIDGIAFQTK
jgi:glutaredoxin